MPIIKERTTADIQYPVTNNQSQVTVSFAEFRGIPEFSASAAVLTGLSAGKAAKVTVVGKTSTSATLAVLVPNPSTNTLEVLDEGTQVQISFTAVK